MVEPRADQCYSGRTLFFYGAVCKRNGSGEIARRNELIEVKARGGNLVRGLG
jgi:hypothetical protein